MTGNGSSGALCKALAGQLRAAGRNPQILPTGGSTPLGLWGYMNGAEEILRQTAGKGLTDVAVVTFTVV